MRCKHRETQLAIQRVLQEGSRREPLSRHVFRSNGWLSVVSTGCHHQMVYHGDSPLTSNPADDVLLRSNEQLAIVIVRYTNANSSKGFEIIFSCLMMLVRKQ